MSAEPRPAFYALAQGGWRDYVTLLHLPYTLWHLSYVAIGAALELVQRVRADAEGEEEGRDREAEDPEVEPRREPRADRDVREVPQRVRRVEQRHVVAPAARGERVERGPRAVRHVFRPQTTMPPPRLRRRA